MPREYLDPAYEKAVKEGDIQYQKMQLHRANKKPKVKKVAREDTTSKRDR